MKLECILLDDQTTSIKIMERIVRNSIPVNPKGFTKKDELLELEVVDGVSYVLICDIVLKRRFKVNDKSGLNVIKDFRARVPDALIIGVSNADYEVESIEAGADYFLSKDQLEKDLKNLIGSFYLETQTILGDIIENKTKVYHVSMESWIQGLIVSLNLEKKLVTLYCKSDNDTFYKSFPIKQMKISEEYLKIGVSVDIFLIELDKLNILMAELSSNDYSKNYDKSSQFIKEYDEAEFSISEVIGNSSIISE